MKLHFLVLIFLWKYCSCAVPYRGGLRNSKDEYQQQVEQMHIEIADDCEISVECENEAIAAKLRSTSGDTPVQPIEDPCKIPVKLENGEITLINATEDEILPTGAQISYQCKAGFQLVGNSVRICTSDGWSGEAPVCEGPYCILQKVENAGIDSDHEQLAQYQYKVGESVDVKCSPGSHFNRARHFPLLCMDNGQWDIPIPKCEDDPCKIPEKLENGEIRLINDTKDEILPIGVQIIYQCEAGFQLVGNSVRICKSDGWSGEEPVCEGPYCKLPKLENAEIDSDNEPLAQYKVGESVDLECLPGSHFNRARNFHLLCMDDGEWDIPVPVCEAVTCELPHDIENGHVVVSRSKVPGTISFGDQITYSCNADYVLSGDEYRWCESKGWSGSEPDCEAIVCSGAPEIPNGRTIRKKDVHLPGEEIDIDCTIGFKPAASTRAYLTCNKEGDWDTTHSNCTAVSCAPPGKPERGYMSLLRSIDDRSTPELKDVYGFTDKVSFGCERGFSLAGKKIITCREGGWTDSVPTCQEIVCQKPPVPGNGSITGYNANQEVFKFEESVTYECSPLYALIGSSERTCTERGWNGEAVECKLRGCPPPEGKWNPFYSLRNKLYAKLENVSFFPFKEALGIKCPSGYRKMYGDAICQNNGKWSKLPECTAIQCSHPRHLTGGTIEGLFEEGDRKYPFGHELFYSCKAGFRLMGAERRICGENYWTPNRPPDCEAIECARPNEIPNGQIDGLYWNTRLKYSFNYTISYHCFGGYQLRGAQNRSCGNDGWLPFKEPSCESSSCKRPAAVTSGKIEGLLVGAGWHYRYPLKHEITYICNPGYHLVGLMEGKRTCEAGDWYPNAQPVCQAVVCEHPNIPNGGYYPLTQPAYRHAYAGGTIKIYCSQFDL